MPDSNSTTHGNSLPTDESTLPDNARGANNAAFDRVRPARSVAPTRAAVESLGSTQAPAVALPRAVQGEAALRATRPAPYFASSHSSGGRTSPSPATAGGGAVEPPHGRMIKWVDLRDPTGAALMVGTDPHDGTRILFIRRLANTSPKWFSCVEKIGFSESPRRNFLYRRMQPGQSMTVGMLREVFPGATSAYMSESSFSLDLNPAFARARSQVDEVAKASHEVAVEASSALRLGRNADGNEVFEGGLGRYIDRPGYGMVDESLGKTTVPAHLFLRRGEDGSLDGAADGVVQAILHNEVIRQEDLSRFIYATVGRRGDEITQADRDSAYAAIDGAFLRHLSKTHQSANDAFGDAVRFYESGPRYVGDSRGKGAMPLALSMIAQRLLGDTSKIEVVYPNAYDGAAFALLPKGTRVKAFRGHKDLSGSAPNGQRLEVQWFDEYRPAQESRAQAIFFNADPNKLSDGTRADYRDAFSSLKTLAPGGRAVLVLAADDPRHPGQVDPSSRNFYKVITDNYTLEDVFETAPVLMSRVGTDSTLRVLSLRNKRPTLPQAIAQQKFLDQGIPVTSSWDEVKARVDQSLALSQVQEAQSAQGDESVDIDGVSQGSVLQRPYIAFSQTKEPTLMVPQELQAPLQAFFTEFEAANGSVDEFVRGDLGYTGVESLADRWGPEQVDALAMAIHRIKRGRGHILGDETGTGKGRVLAGLVAWALKQGKNVVFITDKANLASDLGRDLSRGIGEWGRARPLIMNHDGAVKDNLGDGHVMAPAVPHKEMSRIVSNNIPLAELGFNMVMTTYSQISGEDSEKAVWLKNQLKDSLLIMDEAHVAAGSASNISRQLSEMAALAWGVEYASATWAKSSQNLHVFHRAFPESVNVATLSETMRRGGEAFSEVFSSMMAREGAFIRREHDASKLQFDIEVDPVNSERNIEVADRVASIMSMLSVVAGDLKQCVTRSSDINIRALREARDVRRSSMGKGRTAQLFSSSFGTGSMVYQVMRRINASLNVENGIRLALEGLQAGRKPVLVFDDTGESFVNAAIEAQTQTLEDGTRVTPEFIKMPTIADLLRKKLSDLQMVRVREADEDEIEQLSAEQEQADADAQAQAQLERDNVEQPFDGAVNEPAIGANTEASRADQDSDEQTSEGADLSGLIVDDTRGSSKQGVETARRKRKAKVYKQVHFFEVDNVSPEDQKKFTEGVEQINKLIDQLPEIALVVPDEIINRLRQAGVRVGEISGRSIQLVPVETRGDDPIDDQASSASSAARAGFYRVVKRKKSKELVNATVKMFNDGALNVAVINRAAATGLSMHASPLFLDTSRRQLTVLQSPENPTDLTQLLGRVNRYDQETFPVIQIACTGIFGEIQQIMQTNKKQARMSANVRSDRRALINVNNVPDLLNSLGNEVCRAWLDDNPEMLKKLDIHPTLVDPKAGNVDLAALVFKRIPLLLHKEQATSIHDIYAMFEDMLVQAELRGESPLKPNEMDVRAQLGEANTVFGFDHWGFGSAFDGPVMARRARWIEHVNVLSLEQVLGIVAANREKMVRDGMAVKVGENSDVAIDIDMSALVRKTTRLLHLRACALVSGEFASVADALNHPEDNPVKKQMAKAKWVANNLYRFVPGAVLDIRNRDDSGLFSKTSYVVLGISPPSGNRELNLSQWRVVLYRPGEGGTRNMALSTIMGRLEASTPASIAAQSERSRAPQEHGWAEVFRQREQAQAHDRSQLAVDPAAGLEFHGLSVYSRAEVAGDVVRIHRLPSDRRGLAIGGHMYQGLGLRWPSTRNRDALILTGNMYLASEWAAETRSGAGVIVTDEKGDRHRAVLLNNRFKPETLVRHMPARLWMGGMIERFVDGILGSPVLRASAELDMHTSFDSAYKSMQLGRYSGPGKMTLMPDSGIKLVVGKEQRQRVMALLRGAQAKLRSEELAATANDDQENPQSFGSQIDGSDLEPSSSSNDSEAQVAEIAPTTGEGDEFEDGVGRGRKRRVSKKEAADPAHVVISTPETRKRGRAQRHGDELPDRTGHVASTSEIVLKADSPEKLRRAVRMLVEGPGLEIFVTAANPSLRKLAKDCATSYFIDRVRSDLSHDANRLAQFEEVLAQKTANMVDDDQEESRSLQLLQQLIEQSVRGDARDEFDRQLDMLASLEQSDSEASASDGGLVSDDEDERSSMDRPQRRAA